MADVDNCKRCNKLYRKMHRDICSECADIEAGKIKRLYQFLQASECREGVTLKDLAIKTDISMEEIYNYFCQGSLGTAVMFLILSCPGCGTLTKGSQLRGRFCKACSDEIMREVSRPSTGGDVKLAYRRRPD